MGPHANNKNKVKPNLIDQSNSKNEEYEQIQQLDDADNNSKDNIINVNLKEWHKNTKRMKTRKVTFGMFLQYFGIVIMTTIIAINLYLSYPALKQLKQLVAPPGADIAKEKPLASEKEKESPILRPESASVPLRAKDHELLSMRNRQTGLKRTKRRVKMGIPQNGVSSNIVIIEISITKGRIRGGQHRVTCGVFNSVNYLTRTTLHTLQSLFKEQTVEKVILLALEEDQNIHMLQLGEQKILLKQQTVPVDVDYNWINKPLAQCSNVLYLYSGTSVEENQSKLIKKLANKIQKNQMYHSSSFLNYQEIKELKMLANEDLSTLDQRQLSSYIFLFDANFLKMILPVNFAFMTMYTIEQLIIVPTLILAQSSQTLYPLLNSLHTPPPVSSYHLFSMTEPSIPSLCFVSAPSRPEKVDPQELKEYIQSVMNQEESRMGIRSIVYLPYTFPSPLDYPQFLQSYPHPPKIRFTLSKATITHGCYESSYWGCGPGSLLVAARHHVKFQKGFAKTVLQNINHKHHYILVNYISNGKFVSIPKITSREDLRKGDLFEKYLAELQLFKSDLLKSTVFWALKNTEMDFYQSEAALTIIMLEQISLMAAYIKQPLFTANKRQRTEKQLSQINSVKKYHDFSYFPHNILMPYPFSALDNMAFRRNAPSIIQKNIHQIWLNKNPISPLRLALHNSIKEANPSFKMKLWSFEDLSRENFPLTYEMAHRALERTKESPTSYFAMAADLLRYESVYAHGGIYMDFKMEGRKDMTPWTKYTSFFVDCEVGELRLGTPKAVGNGIFGAVKNSYVLAIVLKEIIFSQRIVFDPILGIPKTTGGFRIREAVNDKDFFHNFGLGYHLLFPYPYAGLTNACGGFDKQFDSDQKVFQFPQPSGKILKIGFPCKQYPQAYLISWPPLARTWLVDKSKIIN